MPIYDRSLPYSIHFGVCVVVAVRTVIRGQIGVFSIFVIFPSVVRTIRHRAFLLQYAPSHTMAR